MNHAQPTLPALIRIDAFGAADSSGLAISPASLLVELADRPESIFPARLLAIGSPDRVDHHPAAKSPALRTIRRPDSVLIPGLGTAHTHLDLTHIGPQPHDPSQGFAPWIEMIRYRRQASPADIAASVARGVELSMQAGVVAVGDIAGAVGGRATLAAHDALAATPMAGTSFVEFFALGAREELGLLGLDAAISQAEARSLLSGLPSRLRLGFQPHAPYSVSPRAYLAAAERVQGRGPICTHLAESPEERELLTRRTGPFKRVLEEFGIWSDDLNGVFGRHATPVQHVRDSALAGVGLLVHVNDATDEDLDLIAASGASVAYCPRASEYFGAAAHFGPHRYQEMLRRGINVVLGTDSVVNLPPEAGVAPSESRSGRGMSILDEMRRLFARDATDPVTLLRMGTSGAAKAIGMASEAFVFEQGTGISGLVAVPIDGKSSNPGDLLTLVMRGDGRPELLVAQSLSESAARPHP